MTQASVFITHCILWNTFPRPHKTCPRAAGCVLKTPGLWLHFANTPTCKMKLYFLHLYHKLLVYMSWKALKLSSINVVYFRIPRLQLPSRTSLPILQISSNTRTIPRSVQLLTSWRQSLVEECLEGLEGGWAVAFLAGFQEDSPQVAALAEHHLQEETTSDLTKYNKESLTVKFM